MEQDRAIEAAYGVTYADHPPLTVTARRRCLIELADLMAAEQGREGQPITDTLRLIVPPLCAAYLTDAGALALFRVYARERALLSRADRDEARLDAAEVRCERLLDQLTGEKT